MGASRWWRTGKVDPAEAVAVLSPHLVDGPVLLGNSGAAVPEEETMRGMDASLALVRPEGTEFHLEQPWEGTSRLRPRVGFEPGGRRYDLALTDYLVRPRLMNAGPGPHELTDLGFDGDADVYLTISLAEAREDWRTKLVAAVLFLPEGA